MTAPKKPATLGKAGARFWRRVTSENDLRPDDEVILEAACRVLDTVTALEDAMRGEPLTVRGSAGQLREHPLLSEARQQRLALSRLLRQLALPEPEEVAEIRRVAKSRRARAAADARWSG